MANWIKRRSRNEDGELTPGVLRCACGARVCIDHDGVECEECGQPYNLFGQRLQRGWSWDRSEADDYRNEG